MGGSSQAEPETQRPTTGHRLAAGPSRRGTGGEGEAAAFEARRNMAPPLFQAEFIELHYLALIPALPKWP